MMKIKILSIAIPAAALFLGACNSTSIGKTTSFSQKGNTITGAPEKYGDNTGFVGENDKQSGLREQISMTTQKRTESGALVSSKSESVNQPVNKLKYFTKIAQARIPIQVVVTDSDENFYRTGRTIAGNIANMGFEVTDEKPFLTVAVDNGTITQFDKYGNYYVFKAEAEISIHRNIYDYIETLQGNYKLLAEDSITSKGTRKLGQTAAVKSAAKELGKEASDWVGSVCKREMAGIKGEKIYLSRSMLNMAFAGLFNNTNSFETCMNEVLKKVAAKPGVLYCIEAGRTDDSVVLEILYRKKNYPNGVFKPAVMSDITFYASSLDERVDELMGYLMR